MTFLVNMKQLYTLGPGETLSNFEVHLKNRQHRAKVQARVNAAASAAGNTTPSTAAPCQNIGFERVVIVTITGIIVCVGVCLVSGRTTYEK